MEPEVLHPIHLSHQQVLLLYLEVEVNLEIALRIIWPFSLRELVPFLVDGEDL